MRYFLIAAVIAVLPILGFARQGDHQPAATEEVRIFGIHVDQALAVGLGVAGGAIGLQILLGGGSALMAGALGGALIGNWWYEQRGEDPGGSMAMRYSAR